MSILSFCLSVLSICCLLYLCLPYLCLLYLCTQQHISLSSLSITQKLTPTSPTTAIISTQILNIVFLQLFLYMPITQLSTCLNTPLRSCSYRWEYLTQMGLTQHTPLLSKPDRHTTVTLWISATTCRLTYFLNCLTLLRHV